jgi:DNA-binding SARP family transcriptional activator
MPTGEPMHREALAMEQLTARLFGGLTVLHGGIPLDFPSKKAATLFAYLVHNRGVGYSRGRLADLLWGDADETSARRNLSTTLWRVRAALRSVGKVELQARGEMVCLVGDHDVLDVDVDTFKSLVAVRGASDEQRLESLTRAEALYKGEFLQGFDCQWCEEDRRHYSALYSDVLDSIVDILFKRGEYAGSMSYLQKLLASDPLSEEVNARLMLAYHLTGKRSTALTLFDQFRVQLKTELGLEPSPATMELWTNLKKQSDWVIPTIHLDTGLAPPRPQWSEIQLIGRECEMGVLIPILADMSAQSTVCAITGDGGVGKSRLVAALGEEAVLRGYEVLRGRCPDLETASPYQVFVQALWPRMQRHIAMEDPLSEIIGKLAAAVSPQALGMIPENGTRVSDSALMSEMLLGLLTEAPAGRGTLVILEDLHHIDRASEGLLRNLLDRTPNGRLILAATMRSDEPSTARILEHLSSAAMVIPLQPLQPPDTERLAAVVLGVDAVPHQLREIIWATTAGVPLFVLELLKYLADKGHVVTAPNGETKIDSLAIAAMAPTLPTRIMEVLRRRIKGLETSQRAILLCAAILGAEVPYAELEAMVERPLDQISEDVEALLQRRLVIEGDGGLRFPHEIVRAAVLSTAARDKRRGLHFRAAKLLEQTGAPTQTLAWHFEEAGDLARASHYGEMSGDTARGLHANADALRWYTISLAHRGGRKNTPDGEWRRAKLLLKRQAVLDLTGDRRGQARDIREALAIATRLDDPGLKAEAEYQYSRLLCRENLNDKALGAAERAIRLYRQLRDSQGEAWASESLGLAHMNGRDQSGARRAFQRALALFRRAGDIGGEARALVHLGTLLVLDGRGTQALRHLERAEQTLRVLDDKRSLAGAVLQKGVLVRDFGQLRTSENLLRTGISLMREIGDRIGEARGLSQLSHTHVAMGRLRDAMHEARRALRVAMLAKDTRAMIIFLNNAAYGAFRCVGDFSRAERFVGKAVQLARETNRQENLANYFDSMATVLLDKGDPVEALRRARQSRMAFKSWKGRVRVLGPQISFRVGMCYFELGEYNRAAFYLERAVAAWEREGEKNLRILALSFVAAAHGHQSRTAQATGYAREVERLLRGVDGVEQLQLVHWNQFRTFQRLGFPAAAKRSLRRAYISLLQQSSDLKGRYRRRFLYGVRRNRQILEEVDRAFGMGADMDDATRRIGIVVHPLAVLGTFDNIEERRKVVSQYLTARMLTQREMALRLGVSERTIRSDIAYLRTRDDSHPHPSLQDGLAPMPATRAIEGARN